MKLATILTKDNESKNNESKNSDINSDPQSEHKKIVVCEPGPRPTHLIDIDGGVEWLRATGRLPSQVPAEATKSMLGLIRHQVAALPAVRALMLQNEENKLPAHLLIPESTVKFCSPVDTPVSLRDGYAFRQHVEAARRNRGVPMIPEFDHFPVFYYSNHLSVCGEGPLKVMPKALHQLDFELEVAIVFGKQGENIPAKYADEYIFGFMIMNDWSARTLQMEEMKLNLGPAKGKDFATSLGPYLVPRTELEKTRIPHPLHGERFNLEMRAFVNGKAISQGNLKDMSWTFAQIVERASYGVTLHPGEVIGSGTVGTGCFLELNGSRVTDNQWLKPGDEIVLEVDELGSLRNSITEAR